MPRPSPATTNTAVGTTTDAGTMTDADWSDVLSRLRKARRRDGVKDEEEAPAHDSTTSENDDDCDFDDFLPYIPLAALEVDGYVAALSEEDGGGAATHHDQDVRRCLRVAQSLLSPQRCRHGGDGAPVPPRAAQRAAVRAGLHLSLAGLLSASSDDVDPTCRTLAARALCNMVTSNPESASVVAGDIPLSPGQPTYRSTSAVIVDDAEGDSSGDDGDTCADEGTPSGRPGRCRPHSCSWVDAIASPARRGGRDAVAAVVASLHNCLASLDDDGPPASDGGEVDRDRGGGATDGDGTAGDDDDHRREGGGRHEDVDGGLGLVAELRRPEDNSTTRPPPSAAAEEFATDISGDRLLVCNLLRNILPVTAAASSSSASSSTIGDEDHADGATEWISLLLTRLVRMGKLPAMYRSAGGVGGPLLDEDDDDDSGDNGLVTPEQVVLLSCVARAAGEDSSVVPIDDGPTMESLASILSPVGGPSESSRREERYPGEDECRSAARSYAADILASSLLPRDDDDPLSSPTQRRRLLANLGGGRCGLIELTSLELGAAVDRVSRSNVGRGARDVTVPDAEGRLIKALVRLIGNLCHRCPENRDLLREVEVPFLGAGESGGCVPSHAVQNDGDDVVGDTEVVPSGDAVEEPPPATDGSRRSGLHVLLSCTSLSHGCFGLREWAVVAIRDALEDNQTNQGVLEELSPRAVATTPPELTSLGIDLELDESGRVRVTRKQKDDG